MIYIDTHSTDVYYNFALEYYFAAEKDLGDTLFLLWRTNPTLMLGKYQNLLEEVDLPYVQANGITLVRRMSGGGTIYTDLGGWQYTFIDRREGEEINFRDYLSPVLGALSELGVEAEFNGRNDLLTHGRKFSGTAQYKLGGCTVHHGSLLYDTDIAQMVASTTVDPHKFLSKSIKSVRDRVTNLSEHLQVKITPEAFQDRMVASILEGRRREYTLTEADRLRICEIAKEEFDNWDRIYGASPKCTLRREDRFAGGRLCVQLEIKKGHIAAIAIEGDFFSALDISLLVERLTDRPYEKAAIEKVLAGLDGGIYGITKAELLHTIID